LHSQREVDLVVALVAAGLSDSEIFRLTGIPRRTIGDWRGGKRPIAAAWPCGFQNHLPLPNRQYAYLLGLYLGDGYLSATRRHNVWRLRIFMDSRYPGIVDECCAALESLFPRQRAHRLQRRESRCLEVSIYSKHWPCLIPQHGPGRKHLREIALSEWQQQIVERQREAFLRGLIHSDGCRIVACERQAGRVRYAARYVFSNKSEDIKKLFCESCDALGIRWTRPSEKDIAIDRLASVAMMDEFVGPKA